MDRGGRVFYTLVSTAAAPPFFYVEFRKDRGVERGICKSETSFYFVPTIPKRLEPPFFVSQ